MAITCASIYLNSPLDRTRPEIRILRVLPGEWPRIIECELSTTYLGDSPPYYNLSYVWGKTQKDCQILVNGIRFPVTRNLQAALNRIRAKNGLGSTLLWVDAICINQVEEKERNHQVSLMGKIYSSCKEVLIWMGDYESPGAHTSQNKIQQFQGDISDFREQWSDHLATFELEGGRSSILDAKMCKSMRPRSNINYISHCAWFLRLLALGEHFTDLPPFCSNFVDQNDYIAQFGKAMRYLSHNSWFHRIWVVQESVLSPSATVLVDSISLPLKVLVEAGKNLRSHTQEACCATSTSSAYSDLSTIRTFLDKINEIMYFKSERKSDSNYFLLLPLCLSLCQREAKEDIDRFYGCLGLVIKWLGHKRMYPDYSLSATQVYLRVCTDFIKSIGSLLPLSYGVEKYRHKDLLSWAFDFMIPCRAGRIDYSSWFRQVHMYDASKGWSDRIAILSDKFLVVDGIEFDRISEIGNVINFHDAATRKQTFREWENMILHPDRPYRGGGTWRDAGWFTLCGSCCWGANSIRRMDYNDVSFFSAIAIQNQMEIVPSSFLTEIGPRATSSGFFKDGIPSQNYFTDILSMVGSTVHCRRLFVTVNGYLGLSREDILVADRLFILAGGLTPFLLRQCGNEFTAKEDLQNPQLPYRLLGESFVHGVMDGEIIERRTDFDSKTLFIE